VNKPTLLLRIACVLLAFCVVTAIASPAQTLTTLFSFDGPDGQQPYATLAQGTNGDLYGTTMSGGAHNGGTVFSITSGGTLTSLYSFCSQGRCVDGSNPFYGRVVQASDGNFYGTTVDGGASDDGTVFKITPNGTLTTLYNFCSQSNCADGSNPYDGLVQGTDGNFYGTAFAGGANTLGTVFKITPSGTLTTLYSFCSQSNCADGANPYAGLIQATDGNFYGTTFSGGANGVGAVFKITPSGVLTTLYSFCSLEGCADGKRPHNGLVQGTDGNLYGTAGGGGAHGGGTVFKITPTGSLTALYSFCSLTGCTDGFSPVAGLLQGRDGNFYGTTLEGGVVCSRFGYTCGTIFKITPSGTLTTLIQFDYVDGMFPEAGLVETVPGIFYGTTSLGGTSGIGTVFRLTLPGP
jgi:uncharacterized repeat protein (TIGR03803 family)